MGLRYLVAALVLAVLSAIYEVLSHGVISAYMVGLAGWPLFLGAIPSLVAWRFGAGAPAPLARVLLACGVLTLSLGSIVAGVMEIYGSTSAFTSVYWVCGAVLMVSAVVAYVRGRSS